MRNKENEEKANQLVKLTHSYEDGLAYIHTDRVLYENLMEMAEWKDNQFAEMKKQIVEKICEWLENNASKYVYNVLDEYDMQYYAFIHRREMIEHLKNYLEE